MERPCHHLALGATADYNSVNPSTERAYEKSPLLRGKLIYLDGLEYFTT